MWYRKKRIQFWSLEGLCDYVTLRDLQQRLVALRVEDRISDTVLFLEHAPVITQGRGLQFTGKPGPRHMPLDPHALQGMAFSETERGGDLTYHGPGQLVIYPIMKLDGKGMAPFQDIVGFLRQWEQILLEVLEDYELPVCRKEQASGIWIRDGVGLKKLASIGIAIRKWVSYHGLGLNCVNGLEGFSKIAPCGYASEVMTRLADYLPLDPYDFRRSLEKAIIEKCERILQHKGAFERDIL